MEKTNHFWFDKTNHLAITTGSGWANIFHDTPAGPNKNRIPAGLSVQFGPHIFIWRRNRKIYSKLQDPGCINNTMTRPVTKQCPLRVDHNRPFRDGWKTTLPYKKINWLSIKGALTTRNHSVRVESSVRCCVSITIPMFMYSKRPRFI